VPCGKRMAVSEITNVSEDYLYAVKEIINR
jgi:hypothetical protein